MLVNYFVRLASFTSEYMNNVFAKELGLDVAYYMSRQQNNLHYKLLNFTNFKAWREWK